MSPAFVARERELDRLARYLDHAVAGHGQVIFVAGEAGSGKTALLREFGRHAEQQYADVLVAVGECNAQTGIGDPYLPWREILNELSGGVDDKLAQGAISQQGAERLRALVGVSAEALVELGPSLINLFVPGSSLLAQAGRYAAKKAGWLKPLQHLSERKPTAGGDSSLDQSRIFEQYANVLKAIAARQPLLLLVDDLHWSDAASISLLFHLGRRLGESRILVAGSYRPSEVALGRGGERHPLEKVLAELKRYGGDIAIDLSQAEQDEGRRFVDALLDSEPNGLGVPFREALHNQTGGQALFTVEFLHMLEERGDLRKDEQGRWVEGPSLDWTALPARVEGVIEERICRLEDSLRETLRVASVEGRDFTAEVVARVQDMREMQLLRSLSEELERKHHLVHERGEIKLTHRATSRLQFAHALFPRFVAHDLGAAQKRLLHGEVARVLEELYAGRLDDVTVQLARHYAEAGEDDKAIAYLLKAGDRARALYANQEAIDHYRRALAMAEGGGWAGQLQHGDVVAHLYEGLGEAMYGQDQYLEAIETWRRGIDLYRARGDMNGVARLYTRSARAATWAWEGLRALQLCREALAVVAGAPPSADQARLLHEMARSCWWNSLLDEAEGLCRQALAMAQQKGAVDVEADTLSTMGALPHLPDEERLATAERAVALAEEHGLLEIAWRAHINAAGLVVEVPGAGLAAAIAHCRRAQEIARLRGGHESQVLALCSECDLYMNMGDLQAAERVVAELRRLIQDVPQPDIVSREVHYEEAWLLLMQGAWHEALKVSEAAWAEAQSRGGIEAMARVGADICQACWQMDRFADRPDWDRLETTLVAIEAIADRIPSAWMTLLSALSLVRSRQGCYAQAHRWLEQAQKSSAVFWEVLFSLQADGELAACQELWDDAIRAWSSLVEKAASRNWVWYEACGQLHLAEAYAGRGEGDDLTHARELYQQAHDRFASMPAPGYVRAIESRLQALQERMGASQSSGASRS